MLSYFMANMLDQMMGLPARPRRIRVPMVSRTVVIYNTTTQPKPEKVEPQKETEQAVKDRKPRELADSLNTDYLDQFRTSTSCYGISSGSGY